MSKQRAIAVEGRAIVARPSLCLLLFLSTALLLMAPAARAEQLSDLVLTKTKPHTTEAAPANWTTPLVMGRREGGIITAAVHPRGGGDLPHELALAAVGGEEIILYTDSTCTTEIATGELAELEGDGIEVEVPEDSVTTFYAIQTDPAEIEESSDCSKTGLTYWESSSGETPGEIEEREDQEQKEHKGPGGGGPPVDERPTTSSLPPAPSLHVLPRARANDNSPRVAGSAPDANTVRLFANAKCSGNPVATVSAADLAGGIPVHVADDTTTGFSAVSLAGGQASPCSEAVTYVEDSTPPHTKITMGPGVKTRHRKVVFRFADITDDPPGTTFLCKVDHKKWKQCNSPFKLRRLSHRRHTLRVRAIDLAGNAEAKPAKRRFRVVRR